MTASNATENSVLSEGLGNRLRQAREDKGASLQSTAAALHLPVSVIEALESERYERLGASIYVTGHLRSYLRWLGLPEALANSPGVALPSAPALQSTNHVPHYRFLIDRYAVRAVYVVLTLSIIVPALWVATQRPLLDSQHASRLLDQPPAPLTDESTNAAVVTPASSGSAGPVDQAGEAPKDLVAPTSETRTVVASMTPFYQGGTAAPAAESAAPVEDSSGWEFIFENESWVEIVGVDGRRLEYGLLRAGERRRFDPQQLARVAIGNANGVELRFNGQPVEFDAFRRANVARFAVSSDGSLSADTNPARD